jgi:Peptidase family M23/Putative peptidoglycan binding domain
MTIRAPPAPHRRLPGTTYTAATKKTRIHARPQPRRGRVATLLLPCILRIVERLRLRSRLFFYALRRWLTRSVIGLLSGGALVTLYLRIDARSLPGVQIAGVALPRTTQVAQVLQPRARRWGEQKVSIVAGPQLIVATRAELGASLDVTAVAARAASLGHSGNPPLDVWVAWRTWSVGRELPWSPRVERIQLGRYVRAIRNLVERPPVAGTIDAEGVTFAGVAGITLDTVASAELLERALRSGQLRVELPLRDVAAPQALAIGTPDGIDEEASKLTPQPSAAFDAGRLAALAPKTWQPPQGCEPMDPPYQHFCQGPRQVPLPFGAAAALAETLELGTIQTVGRLLNAAPRDDWVRAAGGPTALRRDLLWPVHAGRLWRRFGYVRHAPFEKLLHRGIDVGAARGTPLLAVNRGIVAYSDNRVRGYGNLLVIVHDDGSVSFSAHCRAIYVFAGQRVERAQVVGEVGDTGLARGPHVHWEYHVRGLAADPDGLFAGG